MVTEAEGCTLLCGWVLIINLVFLLPASDEESPGVKSSVSPLQTQKLVPNSAAPEPTVYVLKELIKKEAPNINMDSTGQMLVGFLLSTGFVGG